jgi:predicted thioesterase
VLAIPRLLSLADLAAVEAITPSLESGMTSVASTAMEYKLTSPVGAEVVVSAELTGVRT